MSFRHGVSQILTAASQVLNVMCNPFSKNTLAHETFSARCGRLADQKPYTFWRPIIDLIFLPFDGPDHCVNQHLKEQARYTKQP